MKEPAETSAAYGASSNTPTALSETRAESGFYELLKQAPVAIVIFTGPNYIVEFANDLYLPIAGKTREQLLNRPAFEAIPVASSQGFVEVLDGIRKTGQPFKLHEYETRIEQEGIVRTAYLNVVYQPIREGDEAVAKIMILVTEVTEQVLARKQKEADALRLKQVQEDLELAIGIGNIGTWQWNIRNNALQWSKEESALYGLEPGAAPATYEDWLPFIHPDDRERVRDVVENVRQAEDHNFEFRIVRADGAVRWMQSRSRLFYDAQGKPDYVAGVNFDITRAKENEDALFYQKRLLETVTENTSLALFLMDDRQHCIYMNEGAEKMTGFSFAEVQGRQLHYVIHHTRPDGSYYPLEECPIDKALPSHKRMQGEELFIHKDGHFFPVAFTASPIMLDGKPMGTVLEVRDTTDEKKRERALREATHQLELTMRNVPSAIYHYDPTGRIIYANEKGARQMGYDSVDALLAENNIDQLRRHLGEKYEVLDEQGQPLPFDKGASALALKFGKPVEVVVQLVDKRTGESIWTLSKSTALFNEAGELFMVLTTSTDITHQKTAAEAVRQSEEQLLIFGNNIHNLAWIANVDGTIAWYNERWYAYTGTDSDTMQDIDHYDLLPPEFRDHVRSFMKQAWKTDSAWELTFPIRRFDGEFRWFLTRGAPIKNAEGEIYRWIGTNTDIHEQKLAEERFRNLAETLPQLVWVTDAAGEFEYASSQWEYYTGINPQQPNAWEQIVHSDDIKRITDNWLHCLRTGEPYNAEARLRGKTGEYRWHVVRGEPVRGEEGQIVKWIGAFTDVQEQRNMTEKLESLVAQRTKELQRSNDDLQQFAHVASHDLKEPVRKIRTFGSRLSSEFGDVLPERAKMYIQKMESAATRMQNMIEGVLDYSSVSTVGQESESIDLMETFHQIGSDLEVLIHQKSATLNYQNLPVIEGSELLIHQLFYNLVNNALKFSKADVAPVLQVSAKPLSGKIAEQEWGLNAKLSYTQIDVQDNGIGFSQDQAERIFKTFTRLNSKDKYEGTGLGLSLCKKIVERHHGAISAVGMEGHGAIFKVILPLQQAAQDL